SVRVSSWVTTGASSPSFTSSKNSFCSPMWRIPLGRRVRRHDRSSRTRVSTCPRRYGAPVATFITRFDDGGTGVRLAVKDLIDMEGVPTTAGCRAVADRAKPAAADAPLLAGARAAGVRIVGKTNLHELAFGTSGINPWFGTPTNPLDPGLVPGGSSSGSAVAVATDEADVALG